jgi:glutaminyl-tRNA synthetase
MEEIKKKITELRAKNNETEAKILDEKLKSTKTSINSKEAEAEIIKKKHKEREEETKKQVLALSGKDVEEPEDEKESLNKLVARDLKSALNTKELIEQHMEFLSKQAGGAKILTRFPPEPNGYLHVGHAKAMRFSFNVAKNNGGKCYLRYDDTNPDKETKEYITNIEENVKWLGYEPWKITFASDLFDTLHQFAITLIKKGKAFVCHQPKSEVKESRKNMTDSPYRNRSVEENLILFEKMRQGRFQEKECCLRMKIDMKHNNPCMRDPTAYRIKYSPHPHVGDKWCIYPTYDYTHCVHDSLEHITHSLCTLEFEIRRDSYYWLLEALEIYRPHVWEYSRLNLSKNVLSKRRLQTLVEKKIVSGWDDPRLLTINGLRRRGYTRDAINSFIDQIGVTRRGNENILSIHNLEVSVRRDLDKSAPRTMAVINPIKVVFENITKEKEVETLLFPKNPEKGKRLVTLTSVMYIESSDFREIDDEDFFGLSINKETGLKYAGTIFCKSMLKDESGNITLNCVYSDEVKKTKGRIHWISDKDAVKCEARIYDHLFKSENPGGLENYIDDINPNSLVVRTNALVHKNVVKDIKPFDNFQFERNGYYVVDKDTNVSCNKFVFNLTVGLEDKKEDDTKSVKNEKINKK